MNIRRIQKCNLEELLNLYQFLHEGEAKPKRSAFDKVWEDSEQSNLILYWGLFQNERLLSTCQVVTVPNLTHDCKPYCFIENVVTHPDHRNKGLGKAVLNHALNYAWSIGCYKAMLMTGRKTERVLNFYKSVGFNGSEKQAFIAHPQTTNQLAGA